MRRLLFFLTIWTAMMLLPVSNLDAQPGTKNNLRLLYWNIQNGMWDGQTDNYTRFVNWVKEQQPDICVWAEASTIYFTGTAKAMPKDERYLTKNWEELAKRYGHQYVYRAAERDNYPQVITSIYPIENVKRIFGNDNDTIVAHGAGWATITVNGKKLNIVSLHTWPQAYAAGVKKEDQKQNISEHGGDRYRRTEMEYICRHTIGTSPNAKDELWAMMGDFNSKSRVDNFHYNYGDDQAHVYWVHDYIKANTPYVDIVSEKHPGKFIRSTGGGNRIDFIYCTPKLYKRVKSAEIIEDSYTTPVRNPQKISNFWHPSDHLPILVDFKM